MKHSYGCMLWFSNELCHSEHYLSVSASRYCKNLWAMRCCHVRALLWRFLLSIQRALFFRRQLWPFQQRGGLGCHVLFSILPLACTSPFCISLSTEHGAVWFPKKPMQPEPKSSRLKLHWNKWVREISRSWGMKPLYFLSEICSFFRKPAAP